MSAGQTEALIGFFIGAGAILILCALSYGIGLLMEMIIEKINQRGWRK